MISLLMFKVKFRKGPNLKLFFVCIYYHYLNILRWKYKSNLSYPNVKQKIPEHAPRSYFRRLSVKDSGNKRKKHKSRGIIYSCSIGLITGETLWMRWIESLLTVFAMTLKLTLSMYNYTATWKFSKGKIWTAALHFISRTGHHYQLGFL